MGRGGGGSGGSHGGGGGHFNYGSSRGGGHSRDGGRSSSNYSTVYRTSYYRPMTPLGGTLSIVLAIIVIVAGLIAARPNIQQSTIERSKLDSSLCTKVDTWYQDDINWIHDEKTLLKGLKTFYDQTGVQPYLWITDNINGKAKPNTSDFETALKSKYSELFKDEGHVIVCFMESSPEEVFDYPYYDEVGLFNLTGDSYESSVPFKLPTVAVVILLVGVTGGICRVLWRHRRQKRTQEILNTPLDELADSVLKKYGEEDDE